MRMMRRTMPREKRAEPRSRRWLRAALDLVEGGRIREIFLLSGFERGFGDYVACCASSL